MNDDIHIKAKLLDFIQNKTSQEDNLKIQRWLEEREENANLFLKLKKLFDEDNHPEYLPKREVNKEWNKVSASLISEIKKPVLKIAYIRAVATILLLIGIFALVFKNNLLNKPQVCYTTQSGERKSFNLKDGTEVWLNASTTLTIDNRFNKEERIVFLEGEAWFNVTKSQQKPFKVIADEVTVKVLGTQFNVSAYNWDNKTTISLEEGKISLTDGISLPIIMKPGEQADYSKIEQSMSLKRLSGSKLSVWKNNVIEFENTPLPLVVKRIENFYGIKLVSDRQLKSTDLINMRIDNETPADVIHLLNIITNNNFIMEK